MKQEHAVGNKQQVVGFLVVGTVGFAIDAGIVQLLVGVWSIDTMLARAISFLSAASFTWIANRRWSFVVIAKHSLSEYVRYIILMSVGAALNLGIFWVLVSEIPMLSSYPAIAVVPGTAAGMVFNFLAMRWLFQSISNTQEF